MASTEQSTITTPAVLATPTVDDSTLEARIAFAMFHARVKAPRLAAHVGVTAQTVRNWIDEQHASQPNAAELLAIAIATNVPVEWLDARNPFAGLRWSEERVAPPYNVCFTAVRRPSRDGARSRGSSGPGRVSVKPRRAQIA